MLPISPQCLHINQALPVTDINTWEKIISRGSGPGCLQGHTMVEHQDVLYVFGGELSFCNDQETPLWMFDIKASKFDSSLHHTCVTLSVILRHSFSITIACYLSHTPRDTPVLCSLVINMFSLQDNIWEKFSAPRGVVTPKGRRGHSAVIFQDCMYIYGGYQDLRGSTSELWAFHLPSSTWHLVSQVKTNQVKNNSVFKKIFHIVQKYFLAGRCLSPMSPQAPPLRRGPQSGHVGLRWDE